MVAIAAIRNWLVPSSADAVPAISPWRIIAIAEPFGNTNPCAATYTKTQAKTAASPPTPVSTATKSSKPAASCTRFAFRSTRQIGVLCDIRPLICDAATMPAAAAPNSQPNSAGGTLYRPMYTNGALVIYANVPAELNPHTTDAPKNVLSL